MLPIVFALGEVLGIRCDLDIGLALGKDCKEEIGVWDGAEGPAPLVDDGCVGVLHLEYSPPHANLAHIGPLECVSPKAGSILAQYKWPERDGLAPVVFSKEVGEQVLRGRCVDEFASP